MGSTARSGSEWSARTVLPSYQFGIWEGKGRNEKGGFPFYYQRAVKEGVVADGDYGPTAVERMARYIGQYIASPGFSNHQDGLAIDFGTGSVGGNDFGTIGQHSWFHHWLVENAERFGYHPYVKETWHWTYRPPASVRGGGRCPDHRRPGQADRGGLVFRCSGATEVRAQTWCSAGTT